MYKLYTIRNSIHFCKQWYTHFKYMVTLHCTLTPALLFLCDETDLVSQFFPFNIYPLNYEKPQ